MAESAVVSRRSLLARSVAGVVAGAVLPLLAACRGAGGATTSASTGVAATGTTAASSGSATAQSSTAAQHTGSSGNAAPVSPAGGGQQAQRSVTWLVPVDPLIDKYANEAIVPAFKALQPDITVQVVTPSGTGYPTKLLALVAAGTPPEVFSDWNVGVHTLLTRQLATSLSPYFSRAKIDLGYLPPEYLPEYSVNGELYAVPWNSNPNFIVYNKTLFQQYNVPLPPTDWSDTSWTTDKILAMAQTLTHATGDPGTATFGLMMLPGTGGSLGWLWNADAFNDTSGPESSPVYQGKPFGAVYPDRQGMVDAMTWLSDLTLKYKVSPTADDVKALAAQGNAIFSGRVGMVQVLGGWLERQAAVAKPRFDWGIAPMPYGPGGKNTSQREDNAWYLGKGSKNADAGFQLILFATRGAGADDLITYAEDNPPLADTSFFTKWAKNVLAIPGMSMSGADFQAVFEGGIKGGFPDPNNLMDDSSEFFTAFTQLMALVWAGKETPLTGLQTVKAKWQGIIQTLGQQASS
jgi:multiple sugar transport system substrate-binding protein